MLNQNLDLSIEEIERRICKYRKLLKSNIVVGLTKIKIDMNPYMSNISSSNNYMTKLLQGNMAQNIKYIDYKILNDCKTIILNGKSFDIPSWYNKNMILIRDSKTLEMIFYGIINNKIDEMNYYKSKLK